MTDDLACLPGTPKAAAELGVAFYFTGKACPRGHIDKRRAKSAVCNACQKENAAKYLEKRPDKKVQYKREHSKAYYTRNKQAIIDRAVEWGRSNRERRKPTLERWVRNNPEAKRAQAERRRARKAGASGSFSSADVLRLKSLQRELCAVCHISLVHGYEIDHILPLVLGGTNHPRNLQLLCMSCNRSKGAKHPIEFMQSRGFLL